MKRIILFCLAAALCASARPSLQVNKGERVESGKAFDIQLIFPLAELPENRSDLQMEPAEGFSLVSFDSTDQVIRADYEDMFEMLRNGGRPRSGYKARIYTFKLKAPKKTGRISTGQIFMTIDGQKHNLTGDIPANIQRAYSDDALTVSLTPSKKTVYEGEQFSVTL